VPARGVLPRLRARPGQCSLKQCPLAVCTGVVEVVSAAGRGPRRHNSRCRPAGSPTARIGPNVACNSAVQPHSQPYPPDPARCACTAGRSPWHPIGSPRSPFRTFPYHRAYVSYRSFSVARQLACLAYRLLPESRRPRRSPLLLAHSLREDSFSRPLPSRLPRAYRPLPAGQMSALCPCLSLARSPGAAKALMSEPTVVALRRPGAGMNDGGRPEDSARSFGPSWTPCTPVLVRRAQHTLVWGVGPGVVMGRDGQSAAGPPRQPVATRNGDSCSLLRNRRRLTLILELADIHAGYEKPRRGGTTELLRCRGTIVAGSALLRWQSTTPLQVILQATQVHAGRWSCLRAPLRGGSAPGRGCTCGAWVHVPRGPAVLPRHDRAGEPPLRGTRGGASRLRWPLD